MGADEPKAAPSAAELNASEDARQKWFEMTCGLLLAIFASLLAFIDMGGGNAAGDQALAANAAASAFAWYESKSIKQSLAEGQLTQLKTMLDGGMLEPGCAEGLAPAVGQLEAKIARYAQEKTEILEGSAQVGEVNWAQDIDGKLGQVVGANEWKAKVDTLGAVGDTFDRATLFLQLCLVVGAVSLLFQQPLPRWVFFAAMNLTGVIGTIYGLLAWAQFAKFG